MSDFDTETILQDYDQALAGQVDHRTAALVVLKSPDEIGKRYLLNDRELVLGRVPGKADLVIMDPAISSRHSKITYDPETKQYIIEDLQSKNGMLVNVNKTDHSLLENGDKIFLGGTILKFTFLDPLEESYHKELDALMNHDELTGLPVKRLFDQVCNKEFHTARHEEREFSVLMLDMDGLKRINDTMGHQMGSHCISEVGKLIGGICGKNGMATRFGGDEFTVFLRDHNAKKAGKKAEKIRERVEKHVFTHATNRAYPTISIGIAEMQPATHNVHELIRAADEALYRAKKAGRNCTSL